MSDRRFRVIKPVVGSLPSNGEPFTRADFPLHAIPTGADPDTYLDGLLNRLLKSGSIEELPN